MGFWGVAVGESGPFPCECEDLATAWTSSASAHPATTLLALPVPSSLPCPVGEQSGIWGEEPGQCAARPPQTRGRVVIMPTECLPGPELGTFTLSELVF